MPRATDPSDREDYAAAAAFLDRVTEAVVRIDRLLERKYPSHKGQLLFWKDARPALRDRRPLAGKDGKPIDLWHGSPAKNIRQFDPAPSARTGFLGAERKVRSPVVFLATDKKTAHKFGRNRAEYLNKRDYRVYRVHANVETVLDLTKKSDEAIYRLFAAVGVDLQKHFGVRDIHGPKTAANSYFDRGQLWRLFDDEKVVAALDRAGYDAVRFKEEDGSVTVAVLRPEHAKIVESADPRRMDRAASR